MKTPFLFADLTAPGIGWILLLIIVCALLAWRFRRNVVIAGSSLIVILAQSGFLFMDSREHAHSLLAIVGAVVFIAALVVLGITLMRLISGMGIKPVRIPKRRA
jgi:hypothetical protein